jgi:carboxypeptidase C (cathepsin A)
VRHSPSPIALSIALSIAHSIAHSLTPPVPPPPRLFIEQPAGVGFGFNTDTAFKYGDAQAAADNHRFVSKWQASMPQFSKSPFYITSESYGGHYMPTLAAELVKGDVPNFKGFMVGKGPTTNTPIASRARSLAWHARQTKLP